MQEHSDSFSPHPRSSDQIGSFQDMLLSSSPSLLKKPLPNLMSCNVQIIRNSTGLANAPGIEVIENVDLTSITDHWSMTLQALLLKLSLEANLQFQGCQILFFLPDEALFVNCGVYPFNEKQEIDIREFMDVGTQGLRLKVNRVNCSLSHLQMIRNASELMLDGPPTRINSKYSSSDEKEKISSIKNFQKVGYIVKRIISLKQRSKRNPQFREYRFKNDRQLTKKSVEDYYYQIRMGFRYGYDFNENCQQNMKHLRSFVRRMDSLNKHPNQAIQVDKENTIDAADYLV